jgi:hypothetical protein
MASRRNPPLVGNGLLGDRSEGTAYSLVEGLAFTFALHAERFDRGSDLPAPFFLLAELARPGPRYAQVFVLGLAEVVDRLAAGFSGHGGLPGKWGHRGKLCICWSSARETRPDKQTQ